MNGIKPLTRLERAKSDSCGRPRTCPRLLFPPSLLPLSRTLHYVRLRRRVKGGRNAPRGGAGGSESAGGAAPPALSLRRPRRRRVGKALRAGTRFPAYYLRGTDAQIVYIASHYSRAPSKISRDRT
jgi:hypothetical protein